MKRVVLYSVILALLGCSGGAPEGVDITGLPSTDVSPSPIQGALFDVWTFTASVTSSSCPDVAVGEEMVSEYRIVSEGEGCLLSSQMGDGTYLSRSDILFDAEDTVCEAGANTVTLSWQPKASDPAGCQSSLMVTARLELNGDTLQGTYGGNLSVEGTCPDVSSHADFNCRALATLTGVRGRHIQDELVSSMKMQGRIWR